MQRVKGQEVELVLLVNGAPREAMQARSVEINWKTELLQEGYIGETTDRYDSIFKGIQGSIEFHYSTPEPYLLIEVLVDKARRKTPNTKVNLKSTISFPNGKKARIIVPDVEFGEMPAGFGSRSDYGTFKLDFGASEAKVMIT